MTYENQNSNNRNVLSDDMFLNSLCPNRKKLYWRSIRRGMKESDLLLGGFARQNLHSMSDTEITEFESILSLFDADFINYITEKKPIPADINTPLFHAIKAFKPYSV
jgi:antitoxin CptB